MLFNYDTVTCRSDLALLTCAFPSCRTNLPRLITTSPVHSVLVSAQVAEQIRAKTFVGSLWMVSVAPSSQSVAIKHQHLVGWGQNSGVEIICLECSRS